uniref:Large ribosomal subunit protein bL28c n=1 Tax=Trichogloeopsis pedicellata TaxID=1495610 RepID=A0A1G4P0F1_9FLOR|nr:Ribosomal protein L28 [Trichogloeopsis pedicellata]SCW24385.1 Ribosomal protein L28 [Trichogloeopsis pedicellata]
MSKVCSLTGKRKNNAYSISHSHVRTKKMQNINLQTSRVWIPSKRSWLKVKLSTKAMKTILNKHKLCTNKKIIVN